MVMRLIDAYALMDTIIKEDVCVEDVLLSVSRAPTVDAVKVVRCKDCKESSLYKYGDQDGLLCECDGFLRKPDDFCSYGERKENT